MSDYTPTTEEIRADYKLLAGDGGDRDEAHAEFRRWLAAHDAEVAAKALEDAAERIVASHQKVRNWHYFASLLHQLAAAMRKELDTSPEPASKPGDLLQVQSNKEGDKR